MSSLTFYIATSTDDLWLGYDHTSYPPSVGGTYGHTTNNTEVLARKRFVTPTYSSLNILLRWDTSSIPDDATIRDAQLIMSCTSKTDDEGRSIVGEWHNWSTPSSAEYAETPASDAFAAVPLANITLNQDNTFTLVNANASVNKTGYTGIRIGVTGGVPTGVNQVGFGAWDHTTRVEPRLSVTYTSASLPTSPCFSV